MCTRPKKSSALHSKKKKKKKKTKLNENFSHSQPALELTQFDPNPKPELAAFCRVLKIG